VAAAAARGLSYRTTCTLRRHRRSRQGPRVALRCSGRLTPTTVLGRSASIPAATVLTAPDHTHHHDDEARLRARRQAPPLRRRSASPAAGELGRGHKHAEPVGTGSVVARGASCSHRPYTGGRGRPAHKQSTAVDQPCAHTKYEPGARTAEWPSPGAPGVARGDDELTPVGPRSCGIALAGPPARRGDWGRPGAGVGGPWDIHLEAVDRSRRWRRPPLPLGRCWVVTRQGHQVLIRADGGDDVAPRRDSASSEFSR